MRYLLFTVAIILSSMSSSHLSAQDSKGLMNQLENEVAKNKPNYATGTFMTTRIVDGQSVNNLQPHVLDVRISHRFGPVSSGVYNFFGLDNATMRLGFDYGITENLMIGIGHSTYQKTYDAFLKLRLLRQSSGAINMPVTISFVSTIAVNSLKQFDSVKTQFSDRTSYVYELLIARKFSENFALQVMPVLIREDNISFEHPTKYVYAIGMGARQRVSKRLNFNAEYYYQMPGMKAPGAHNVFSFGVDLGTGGHVFQLDFTNSLGLTEKSFITETTGRWEKRNIMFGFTISRVFQLKKNH